MKAFSQLCRACVLVIAVSAIANDVFGQSWSIDTYGGRASYNIALVSVPSRTGLSRQIGAKPDGATKARKTAPIVLRIALREAGVAPSVAGDFTNWKPIRMTRYENEWRLRVNLAPGVYHFAFRKEDGEWFVPPSIPNRTEDGMGGWVAVLVVQ